MLSVLIPTYHYNCVELATEIHQQALALEIPFEIICLDDASANFDFIHQNSPINFLKFGTFQTNPKNIGRAANRNRLAQIAKYDWLLFIDCDTQPVSKKFIKNYIDAITTSKNKVFFGGIAYKSKPYLLQERLRYSYGIEREAISFNKRKRNSYNHTLTSNLLIHRSIFQINPFNVNLKKYGYEDLVFIYGLKQKHIKIGQLDNPVYHLNLENTDTFIKKCEEAIEHLIEIEKLYLLPKGYTKIQWIYQILKIFRLHRFLGKQYLKNKFDLIKKLHSTEPNIRDLDWYKLTYYCYLKNQ